VRVNLGIAKAFGVVSGAATAAPEVTDDGVQAEETQAVSSAGVAGAVATGSSGVSAGGSIDLLAAAAASDDSSEEEPADGDAGEREAALALLDW
jgi:hypothetical protein